MNSIYYIGLDIHKKVIAYCIKRIDGALVRQGSVAAERKALNRWLAELPGPWYGAMEATLFTGWVYDFLKPYAIDLKVAHPAMLKAILEGDPTTTPLPSHLYPNQNKTASACPCTWVIELCRVLEIMTEIRQVLARGGAA